MSNIIFNNLTKQDKQNKPPAKPTDETERLNISPKLPLYLSPPRCFTCGNMISHLFIDYSIQLNELTDGITSDLPIRAISDKDVKDNSIKTYEGQILDNQGVLRYCCRLMILTQVKQEDIIKLPVKQWAEFKQTLTN